MNRLIYFYKLVQLDRNWKYRHVNAQKLCGNFRLNHEITSHFSIQHFQSPLKTRKVHKLFYWQKRLICCLKCWHKHQTWINSHHFLSYVINACTQQMDQDMHTIPKSFTFQGLTKSWIFLTLRVLLLTFCVEWCTSVNKRHWCYHSHPPKTKSCSSEKKKVGKGLLLLKSASCSICRPPHKNSSHSSNKFTLQQWTIPNTCMTDFQGEKWLDVFSVFTTSLGLKSKCTKCRKPKIFSKEQRKSECKFLPLNNWLNIY